MYEQIIFGRPVKAKESKEQEAFVKWFRIQYPDILINSDIGGVRLSIGQATKAKRSGRLKGWPDLFIAHAAGVYHGMFIEMKRPDGGIVSIDQTMIKMNLEKAGYYCVIARGCEDAIYYTRKYFDDSKSN